jgi:hypothetical protein
VFIKTTSIDMFSRRFVPLRATASFIALAFTCLLLSACSGIPVSSIPRLLNLNAQLLDANPAEFSIAIQIDSRMSPPPGGVPVLEILIEPREAGGFETVTKKIPLNLINTGLSADANSFAVKAGLQSAPNGRRWLLYNFAPASQSELIQTQSTIKKLMNDKKTGSGPGKGGGKVTAGIAQDSMVGNDAAFANTRWESWLQTRKAEGFFELWSGTVGGLIKQTGLGRTTPNAPR